MAELEFKTCARLSIVMCAAVLCSSFAMGQDYSTRVRNPQTERAYQKLVHANVFVFGGVGWGSMITPEEKAFHTLLDAGNSVTWFKRLVKEANPEGQMYALYGLYLEDRDAFKKEAARLQHDDGPPAHWEGFIFVEKGRVRTADGCVFGEQNRQSVIAGITNGAFDRAFKFSSPRLTY